MEADSSDVSSSPFPLFLPLFDLMPYQCRAVMVRLFRAPWDTNGMNQPTLNGEDMSVFGIATVAGPT